jgi:ABC-type phosphate transport system substrate-binding protein
MRLNAWFAILFAVAAWTVAQPAAATEPQVSGAATVACGIILPNQAAIERETGLTLVVTANGDGNGLKGLYAGRSDVAMVAAPMAVSEQTVNKPELWIRGEGIPRRSRI